MTTPRPHAELIKRWADDDSLQVWIWGVTLHKWLATSCQDILENPKYIFAVGEKPTETPVMPRKTCTLGGLTFPMPETVAPAVGTRFWLVNKSPDVLIWGEFDCYLNWLSQGLIHLTEAGAVAHYAALQAANRQAIEGAV